MTSDSAQKHPKPQGTPLVKSQPDIEPNDDVMTPKNNDTPPQEDTPKVKPVDIVVGEKGKDTTKLHKWTEKSIEENSNCFNKLFFMWTSTMVDFGYKHSFSKEDLFEVRRDEKFEWTKEKFDMLNAEALKGAKYSLFKVLFKIFRGKFLCALTLMTIQNILQFAGPLLLKEILLFIEDEDAPDWKGYVFAASMFVAFLLRSIITQQGFHQQNSMTFRAYAALQNLIATKSLKISAQARNHVENGQIINMATVDVQTVFMSFMFSHFVFTAPISIIIAIILIILEVGAVGLIGLAVIVIGFIFNAAISKLLVGYRTRFLKFSDRRAKAMSEYISGIKIIKYYGWEKMVLNKIDSIRFKELGLVLKSALQRANLDIVTNITPVLIALAVFGLYIGVGNTLTAATAFTTLSLFNLIQLPIRMLGFSVFFFAQGAVSLKRLQMFGLWEDFENYVDAQDPKLEVGDIKIENGEFSWDTEKARKHAETIKKMLSKRRRGPPGAGGPPGKGGSDSPTKKPEGKKSEESPEGKKPEESQEPKNTATDEKIKDTVLENINVQIGSGQFVAVIGKVGSGKSSLLGAMLGEMHKINGSVGCKGKIAYVPQQAWLRNATLRDNILFGSEYDETFYRHVLRISELDDDIDVLPSGDMTEIGEKGINLSGGQKQRVSIARAIYARADIYIIDDALSALDAHVGKKIYDHVLRRELRQKTIVFVTHALQYINECDNVIVMKGGQVVEMDKPAILAARPDSEYNKLRVVFKQKEEEEKKEEEAETKENDAPDALKVGGKKTTTKKTRKAKEYDSSKGTLTKQETKETGAVAWKVYKAYLTSAGKCYPIMIVILFLLAQGVRQVNDFWIGAWSSDSFDFKQEEYVGIYAAIAVGTSIIALFRGYAFSFFSKNASRNIHKKLLYSVFRSPMSWFDTTPSGNILNRTTKDQDDIDVNLPWTLQFAAQSFLMLIFILLSIGIITPWFWIFAAVSLIFYIWAVKKFLRSSRELKRLERNAISPAVTTISEIVSGYQLLRAYGKQKIFMDMIITRFNGYLRAALNGFALQRWVGLRTDLFGSFVVGAAAIFGVLAKTNSIVTGEAGFIGLAISWSLTLTGMISFTVKVMADTELAMSAVERILKYIEKPEKEAEWEQPKAVENWPTDGRIKAENVAYKYRENLPEVIHSINFAIEKSEKIGVVGRTGSGKSTLTLGMLRILELAKGEKNGNLGKIDIDGQEIGKIGLHELRKRVTIIPQDPVLFTGSIKENVDPFGEYKDEDIIDALKKVQIWDQIKIDEGDKEADNQAKEKEAAAKQKEAKKNRKNKNKNRQAEYELTSVKVSDNIPEEDANKLKKLVTDGGGNFSLGQRQLLCMARAMVRRSKVLLMDEATASIDEHTDHLIQKMIKNEFKETTVFTIAHRLITIIQYDRIIVLDKGNIVEFDTPLNLLGKEGYFLSLVQEAGPEFEKKMRYLAQHKEVDATGQI